MSYRKVSLLVAIAFGILISTLKAQKLSTGILKTELFAPFNGNVSLSYQWLPERRYASPEIGLGYIGPWAAKYHGLDEREGCFVRLGLFVVHGNPVANPKHIWRRLYCKTELAMFQQQAGLIYPSRELDTKTGFYSDVTQKETYKIKGASFTINLGKQVLIQKWVFDFSFGIGIMYNQTVHQIKNPNAILLSANDVFPIQGPFPIYGVNELSEQLQASLKVGYKFY